MRSRLALITLCLAATGALVAGDATAAPAHTPQPLPRLIVGSYSGIKPKVIGFSGDGGNIVTELRWKRWNQTTAVGHGTSDLQGCVPNCAQGSETPVPATVTLSKPRNGHFTKIVEVRAGLRLVGYYGRPSWPEGAQQR
jgi:hypothetical protein